MSPFLNLTTVGFMVKLSLHFQSRVRHMPPFPQQIFTYLCGLFFAITFCFGIIALTSTIILLPSFDPKSPLPIVHLHSLSVNSLTTTTVNFNATFLFVNPNRKLTVSYTKLEAKLWYGRDDLTLASTELTPFSQGMQSETKVEAELTVVDDGIVKRIGAKRDRGGGLVNFGVSLLGWVGLGHGRLMKTRSVRLTIVCDRVAIVFPPGNKNGIGTLVGPIVCRNQ